LFGEAQLRGTSRAEIRWRAWRGIVEHDLRLEAKGDGPHAEACAAPDSGDVTGSHGRPTGVRRRRPTGGTSRLRRRSSPHGGNAGGCGGCGSLPVVSRIAIHGPAGPRRYAAAGPLLLKRASGRVRNMRAACACLWLAVTLVLDACGPGAGSQAATPVATAPPSAVAPVASSSVPGSNLSPEQQAAVAAVVQDAAARLSISPNELSVDRVEAREWGDSSLGCPQPGNLYSQIVTPGFLIVINSGGKQLEYHSDTRARVVLCKET
jgi:hypothetical protein